MVISLKQSKNNFKHKLSGLTFNTWLIFTLFASAILIMLWFLQLSLLPPYYRAAKIGSVKSIADNIEIMINNNQPLNTLNQTVRENSLCIQLVDNFNNKSFFNGLGSGCYLENTNKNNEDKFNYNEVKESILASEENEYNYLIDYGSEMVVYGRVLDANLGRYILLINAPVTPESAGFELIQNQFVYLTILVLAFATIASIIIARRISKPFITMTKSAKSLADQNFDVQFYAKGIQFNEFEDLTQSLNYATQELKKVEQLRVDLIANVSHDIKTPLTMILAYTEMIQDFSKDDKELLLEHLDVIMAEAKYLDTLVENMFELSMLQSGSIKLNLEKFNLNDLVNEIANLFKKEKINVSFKNNNNYIVEADRVKIGQVIHNFITNAIKYADNSPIEVKLSHKQSMVRLSVIDRGPGISEEELKYVWDRYYRIDKNFHREKQGSGLGLSIARGIIIAHHGLYGVESQKNKGSEFFFEIAYTNILE